MPPSPQAAAPIHVHRLASADAVAAIAGRAAGDGPGARPERGFSVGDPASCGIVVGVRRDLVRVAPGVGRGVAVTAAPVLTRGDVSPAAIDAALRELVIGEPGWHVLRLVDPPRPVVDAVWRLASALGYACAIAQDPPPTRDAEGAPVAGPLIVSVYSPRLKGRWLRAADSGVGSTIGGAARERLVALLGRARGARAAAARADDESGRSRFLVLDLATVPAEASWGREVTFAEVTAEEAEAEPLRYCTSVRRLHEALRRGDRCFGTWVDGDLAHHHWVSTDPAFLRAMLPARALDRPVAHPFDSYTYPEFRGRRLQAITHHWLALRYREEGVSRFVVRVTATNAASIRGVMKAGYVELSAE